ncbi:MAG: hypothetical protein GX493_06590, partial [Firmicutes bacterium]|nr:hypothetical protein [Bacillota bacterium]
LLVGLGVAVFLVSLLFFRGRSTPTITARTSPSQVVATYYRALEKLDPDLLEETLTRGVARGTVNMVTHLYVIHRVTTAYSGKPLDSPGPIRIKDLRIVQTRRQPPEFLARYQLILERGSGEDLVWEIQDCEDRLRLGRRKDRRVGEKWVIVALSQKTGAKREVKPKPEEGALSPSR